MIPHVVNNTGEPVTHSISPLDPYLDNIKEWVEEGSTNSEVVERLRGLGVVTSEASVRRAKVRIQSLQGSTGPRAQVKTGTKKDPALTITGEKAVAVGPVRDLPMSIEELAAYYKISLEEWEPVKPLASWWGSEDKPSFQLKVTFIKKKDIKFIVQARNPDYTPPKFKKRSTPAGDRPSLWVFPGDQHAPIHSVGMHEKFLKFLHEERPANGVLMGDGLDFADVSRHRDNPEWSNTAQECLDGYHRIVCDYRSASLGTKWQQLWGNHDYRLRNDILTRAERLYGIRPANSPDARHILDLRNLLHYDDLDITTVEPDGEYTHAQVVVAPDLIARHGWVTGPNAMAKAMKGLTCSIIYGHVHSENSRAGTRWSAINNPTRTWAFENGTMMEIPGGGGYAMDVNWSPCFSAVEVWPDGRWNHEFVRYDGKHLYWRNKRY